MWVAESVGDDGNLTGKYLGCVCNRFKWQTNFGMAIKFYSKDDVEKFIESMKRLFHLDTEPNFNMYTATEHEYADDNVDF